MSGTETDSEEWINPDPWWSSGDDWPFDDTPCRAHARALARMTLVQSPVVLSDTSDTSHVGDVEPLSDVISLSTDNESFQRSPVVTHQRESDVQSVLSNRSSSACSSMSESILRPSSTTAVSLPAARSSSLRGSSTSGSPPRPSATTAVSAESATQDDDLNEFLDRLVKTPPLAAAKVRPKAMVRTDMLGKS